MAGLSLLFGEANDGGEAALNVGFSGGVGGHADAHGGAPLPDGAAAPACAIPLNSIDDATGGFVVAKGHQHLIEAHLVEDIVARGAQSLGEMTFS